MIGTDYTAWAAEQQDAWEKMGIALAATLRAAFTHLPHPSESPPIYEHIPPLHEQPTPPFPEYTADIQTNVYMEAAECLRDLLMTLPDDAPRSAVNALEFARAHFADLGESQSPDFLADDERVDLSDVIPIDDTPYDEEGAG